MYFKLYGEMVKNREIHDLATSIYSTGGMDNFHRLLYSNSSSRRINDRVKMQVSKVMQLADKIHANDTRHDKSKYIHHQIRIIISYVEKYGDITPHDTIVFMLHDAIEDHPEYWKEIFDLVWVHIFRDVIILATGGILLKYRKEMLDFFHSKYPYWDKFSKKWVKPGEQRVFDLIRILSPADPLFKLGTESAYHEINGLQDFQKIDSAIRLYKESIILPESKWKNIDMIDEYMALGNYLYFTKDDARRKLQDMLDNISDMEEMEKRKPGYTEKRRVKAYILWVKLKNFGMMREYAELENAFQEKGSSMLKDFEVLSKYRDPELH
jgi:hypothetical protein